MKQNILLSPAAVASLCGSITLALTAEPAGTSRWSLDDSSMKGLSVHGEVTPAAGVKNQSLVFDGHSLIELNDSANLSHQAEGFSLNLWVNPYAADRGEQQILAGKNRYSLDQREWGVMIDADGKFRLYVQSMGWKTATAKTLPKPGHWQLVGIVIRDDHAGLWINGTLEDHVTLKTPAPRTGAPITLGGIDDGVRKQLFHGAFDEVQLDSPPLSAGAMAALHKPVSLTHEIPEPPERFPLWDESETLPLAADLPELEGVEFHVIKKWDQPADGYTFLHGVSLVSHKGRLYASIGHNQGAENTVTEEAQYRVSEDDGKTWGPLQVIDAGEEENLAVSHGVFLSHEGTLWAFHGAYNGFMENIHTRAYSLNEETGEWRKHGVIVENGFWAMNQPVKMNDGNWIMPGGSFGPYANEKVFPAAVAISRGDDFTKWDFVRIEPSAEITRMWGESSLIVDGPDITNIARYGGGAQALVATSEDFGRTWTESEISNLPMTTSKPAAGMLSTGQRYLVCTTADRNGGKRSPLTIAVSRPGEDKFSKVFVIRRSEHAAPGESAERLSLSYPCATGHEGKLYVGYSNNGGRKGNLNSAELAVIPLSSLEVK